MGVKRKKAAKTLRKNAANRKIFCKLRALSLFLDLPTGHSLKHHGVNPVMKACASTARCTINHRNQKGQNSSNSRHAPLNTKFNRLFLFLRCYEKGCIALDEINFVELRFALVTHRLTNPRRKTRRRGFAARAAPRVLRPEWREGMAASPRQREERDFPSFFCRQK